MLAYSIAVITLLFIFCLSSIVMALKYPTPEEFDYYLRHPQPCSVISIITGFPLIILIAGGVGYALYQCPYLLIYSMLIPTVWIWMNAQRISCIFSKLKVLLED